MTSAAILAAAFLYSYTVMGEDGRAIARAITDDDRCPAIAIDARAPAKMTERAAKVEVPAREGAQPDSKPAQFPVLTCEHALPRGARSASIKGVRVPVPKATPRRIVIIGDTGCRMKASEDAWQKCDDEWWPFERVVKAAASMKPDLVVHLGDMHYRESPCASGSTKCSESPWGYGFDAWEADFFHPAGRLLRAAPWVFVRGNHESCARAGQGWFRFIDPRPFSSDMSCDDPARDAQGDFTAPYAVPIGHGTQFIVFDSSRTPGKRYAKLDEMFVRFAIEFSTVDALAKGSRASVFLSHHPVLAFHSGTGGEPQPGNAALQQVMEMLHPGTFFPGNVALAMHGHVHLFEALSFESRFTPTIVAGNSGSQMPDPLPTAIPAVKVAPGANVEQFTTHARFGFLVMERAGKDWRFTSRDTEGRALVRCELKGRELRCGEPR